MGLEKQVENDKITMTEAIENGTRVEMNHGGLDFNDNVDSSKEEPTNLRLFKIQ